MKGRVKLMNVRATCGGTVEVLRRVVEMKIVLLNQ